MADNDDFIRNFLRQMSDQSAQNQMDYEEILAQLRAINSNISKLTDLAADGKLGGGFAGGSQSSARDARDSNKANSNSNNPFSQHHANRIRSNAGKTFLDGFEKSLMDALGGSAFKKRLQESLESFASALGTDLEHLEEEFGAQLGKVVGNTVKNDSGVVGKIFGKVSSKADSIFGKSGQISELLSKMKSDSNYDYSKLMKDFQGMDLGKIGNFFKNGKAGQALNKGIESLGGEALAAGVMMKRLQEGAEGAAEVLGGLSDLWDAAAKAGNRYEESRKKNQEYATERFKKDVETLITEPFTILRKAAEDVYEAWNANIRLIGQTQGYNKADLQNLMAAYAAKIQSEGLSNVIPATDVYNNLGKVISAGLTGNAAVEFAYQATKYNAAIPNQDFFNLVDSYASVAATAIAAGKSESEALQIANQSLEDFSNSLLYASRTLTGGYSSGLKSADSIYTSAVKIAQAAKSDNISQIASSLLAIQGYVGSIAPDLATSLSDKIYQLATGGNSSDIVALRSLAGINASNTEFLKMLAENPKSVLGSMFANLGLMFTQSPDAYMEKAEGYASLFGLSAEAFQRIDFMSLAAAIGGMADNTSTLEENLNLLKEGQTTTSTEQLKIAQINKYMVEEGLAYVIDNEAAQMIQQHMWDEQLARQLMEANYAVELKGAAGQALEKILEGLGKILQFLSPIFWIAKAVSTVTNVVATAVQAEEEQHQIKKLLQLSLVGEGNKSDLMKLIRRNTDLSLSDSLVHLMGGNTSFGMFSNGASLTTKIVNSLGNPLSGLYDFARGGFFNYNNWGSNAANGVTTATPGSVYGSWGSLGNVSKAAGALSAAILSMSATNAAGQVSQQIVNNVTKTVSASAATAKEKLDRMMSDEYMTEQFVKAGKDYSDWAQTAARFGISNFEEALDAAGYSEEDLKEYFASKQSEAGLSEKAEQYDREKRFQDAGTEFWTTRFWEEYSNPLASKLDSLIRGQIDWKSYFNTTWVENAWKADFVGESGLFSRFFDEFIKTFVEHAYYNDSNFTYSDVTDVQRREDAQKGDAIYALADALTGNLVDLKNPTVQTNALLAQILVVVSAIMNQNNTVVGTVSLADALAGLAVGLTTTTPLSENPLQNA